jgi:hypothetical protein
MAIGWFSVLKAVPWGQVIDNAPKVVEGAKKFWSTVATKSSADEREVVDVSPESDEDAAMQGLKQRLAVLEKANSELHQQMVVSSGLIKTLADQNAQLVNRIEANRKRMVWLTLLCVLTAVATLALVAFILAQNAT